FRDSDRRRTRRHARRPAHPLLCHGAGSAPRRLPAVLAVLPVARPRGRLPAFVTLPAAHAWGGSAPPSRRTARRGPMAFGPLVRVVDAGLGQDAQVRLVVSGVSAPARLRAAWASSGAALEIDGQRLRATTTVEALA